MASTNKNRLTINYMSANLPNQNGWKQRHTNAIAEPKGHELAIVALLRGWLTYADKHYVMHESRIGDDYVLGPAWAGIGAHIRTLLNGSLGRLDGGTLDTIIVRTLEAEGFDPDVM